MITNRLYLLLTFLVIAISGNPAMGVLGKEIIYVGTFLIFVVLWGFKSVKLMRHDMLILALFALLTLSHLLIFGSMVVASTFGFLIKLGIALLAVRLISEFSRKYVSVMYVLACMSLVFYIPVQLGVDLAAILSPLKIPLANSDVMHIGIHNFNASDGRDRNSGMFWEPGAFAGYLILALFFFIRDVQAKSVLSKQGLVLIAALLSTQSTTGYLAFMVLAVFYGYNSGWFKDKIMKWIVSPVLMIGLVLGFYVAVNEVSFLGEKINAQIESASVRDDTSRINRFGNFLYDLDWIANRPVVGWSATPETRFSTDPDIAELIAGQGNGLTGFAIRFGMVGLFTFIGFFAYATQRITGSLSASVFGLVIVCALLNGEQFLGFPMFLTLMFVPQRKSKTVPVLPVAVARKSRFAGRRPGYRA